MAAANRLDTYCGSNFAGTNHFPYFSSETNTAVMSSTQVEVVTIAGLSVENYGCRSHIQLLEMEEIMRKIFRNFFREHSELIQKIRIAQYCLQHSSKFGKKCKIRLINEMKSSNWHSTVVDSLLNVLIRDSRDFILVIVFGDGDPSDTYDLDLVWDFHFSWQGTGFACIVEESVNGYEFSKQLEVLDGPTQQEFYLKSEKRKDLCVVRDGENILLEPMHPDSFITAWSYCGSENDRSSRHCGSKMLTVFGFRLNGRNSDVTKCLGATNKDKVGLMQANIPDHGKVLATKTDNRFFYQSRIHGCYVFESTQYENHFLAVKDSDEESISPRLYLKQIITDKEYDEEIMFQMCPKHN